MRTLQAADPLHFCPDDDDFRKTHDCHTEGTASSPLSSGSCRFYDGLQAASFEIEESSSRLMGNEFPEYLSHPSNNQGDGREDSSRRLPLTTGTFQNDSMLETFHQESEASGEDLRKTFLRASLDAGMTSISDWIRSKRRTVEHSNDGRHEHESDYEHENDHVHEHNSTIILPLELMDHFNCNDSEAWCEPPLEQDDDRRRRPRHRTQSEPDATRLRDHYLTPCVRRRRGRAVTEDLPCSTHSIAIAFLPPNNIPNNNNNINSLATEYHGPSTPGRSSIEMTSDGNNTALSIMPSPVQGEASAIQGSIDLSSRATGTPARVSNSSLHSADPPDSNDPERRARMRWIRINRRFQLVITFVALLFSLLLFGVLVCWVVLTSSYVVSFDKSCDVPLKPYFWLVTLQLVLDVFRGDIMRVVFSWDGTSNQRIPARVVVYNMAYLIYAVLVLRLGISSVFVGRDDNTCRETAPELYNASAAFISLSIAAWATIICGYLLPFCVVAALLTYNGYNPSSSQLSQAGGSQPVFPAAYSNTGAPSSCIEMLPVVPNELVSSGDYPRECCICMEDFRRTDVVVETYCKHVFHKQCCREWLLHSRTCPICRTDIPSHLNVPLDDVSNTPSRSHNIPLGPTGRPVVGLLRILNPADSSITSSSGSVVPSPLRARTLSSTVQDTTTNSDIEEGFRSR